KGVRHLFVFTFLLLLSHSVHSREFNWLDGFFITASGQYYIIPDIAGVSAMDLASKYGSSAALEPSIGFRAGLGYEYKNISLAVEAGYSHITGNNPLVLEIAMIPVMLKLGYSFFPLEFIGLRQLSLMPTFGVGFIFADAEHHKDIIDMLLGNLTNSKDTNFFLQPGVRIGWDILPSRNRLIEVFAGFSVDMNIENDGIIPLPQIELGLIFRPFGRWKPAAAPISETREIIPNIQESFIAVEEKEPIIELEIEDFIIDEIVEIDDIEEIIEEQPEIELIHSRAVFHVLFGPDQTIPTLEGLATLDTAGTALEEFVNYTITLRGFAAPFVSTAGQMEISRQRTLYCADYLSLVFNIPKENIITQWLGASSLPEDTRTGNHVRRRSVEIIIEGQVKP
ncbi:MAG: hypothetical protein FWD24_06505, partial [Treponema sp.]|nr:hypothetical protein [Treponema sp.]